MSTRREFIRDAGLLAAAVGMAGRSHAETAPEPKGANDRLGIGMIGCGGRGGYHLSQLQKMKDAGANIEIAAICDAYSQRLNVCTERFKTKPYKNYHELIADPNVDIVCVATPDHLHGQMAIDAIHAGKHVYCEKPVTHWRQFDLTKRLFEEVKKSKVAFQLGAQAMSDSAWRQMRQLIKDGLIGQPIHAECGYFRVGDWGERGMPIPDPNVKPGPDLDWEGFLGDAPKREYDISRFFRWRMYEDYSGGPVTDLFPHSLSPTVSMLGVGMPAKVVATGGKFRYQEREIPDTFNMLIDYPESITVAVLGTQGNNYNATGGRGAGGRIPVIRGWDGSLTVEGEEIVFIPADESNKQAQRFPIEFGESIEGHWNNLFDCARNGKQPECPIDLAFHVQTALQMATLSQREGKVATFDKEAMKIVL